MYSFVSKKGPSVNNASPPRLSMTVAELGAARPPAKTQCPSASSRSLNTLMAAISVGVAEPVLSSITETRYCISDHLLWLGRPSLAAARLVGQTSFTRWVGLGHTAGTSRSSRAAPTLGARVRRGRFVLQVPGGPVDLDRYPFGVDRESTRSSAVSGPVSGNSR